jgi:hypothetical protein
MPQIPAALHHPAYPKAWETQSNGYHTLRVVDCNADVQAGAIKQFATDYPRTLNAHVPPGHAGKEVADALLPYDRYELSEPSAARSLEAKRIIDSGTVVVLVPCALDENGRFPEEVDRVIIYSKRTQPKAQLLTCLSTHLGKLDLVRTEGADKFHLIVDIRAATVRRDLENRKNFANLQNRELFGNVPQRRFKLIS